METITTKVNKVLSVKLVSLNEVKEITSNYNMGFITSNEYLNQLCSVSTDYIVSKKGICDEEEVEVNAIINYIEANSF